MNYAQVPKYGLDSVDSPVHRSLALHAAQQGVVLLQNNMSSSSSSSSSATNTAAATDTAATASTGAAAIATEESTSTAGARLLPLDLKRYSSIAMIGPNANATSNLLGGYHGSPPFTPISPLAAMQAAATNTETKTETKTETETGTGVDREVLYAKGCTVNGDKGDNATIDAAVALAKGADVVVMVLGLCGKNNEFIEFIVCGVALGALGAVCELPFVWHGSIWGDPRDVAPLTRHLPLYPLYRP